MFLSQVDGLPQEQGWLAVATNLVNFDDSPNTIVSRTEEFVSLIFASGFTPSDVAVLLWEHPGLVSSEPLAITECGIFFSQKLKIRKYDFRKLVRENPSLLTAKGLEKCREMSQVMLEIGISENGVKAQLESYMKFEVDNLVKLCVFLCGKGVGLKVGQLGGVFKKSKELFGEHNNYENMFKVVKTLKNGEGGGINLGIVVAKFPNVLLLEVERIKLVVDFLHEECNLNPFIRGRVIEAYPTVLSCDLENLRGTTTFFKDVVDIDSQDFPKIIRAFPHLLTTDIVQMNSVVEFLQGIGVVNVGRFVTRLPPILTYSVNADLKPKWQFLEAQLNHTSTFDLVRFPAYFSYPLEKVIRPRFEYLRWKNMNVGGGRNLEKFLTGGDKDFCERICYEEGVGKFLKWRSEVFVNEMKGS